jgi:hypothetical protein
VTGRVASDVSEDALRRLLDQQAIRDVLHRYSRGVDRGDWDLVGSAYHSDGFDDHGAYKGDVPGLLTWLSERFAGVQDSSHFLGQTLVEFHDGDSAFVETYFVSRRLVPGEGSPGGDDMLCREVWGRYADEFERRDGQWAVSRRLVLVDARYLSPALDGRRRDDGFTAWGMRGHADAVLQRAPTARQDTGA